MAATLLCGLVAFYVVVVWLQEEPLSDHDEAVDAPGSVKKGGGFA
jgi:hypothetical protein